MYSIPLPRSKQSATAQLSSSSSARPAASSQFKLGDANASSSTAALGATLMSKKNASQLAPAIAKFMNEFPAVPASEVAYFPVIMKDHNSATTPSELKMITKSALTPKSLTMSSESAQMWCCDEEEEERATSNSRLSPVQRMVKYPSHQYYFQGEVLPTPPTLDGKAWSHFDTPTLVVLPTMSGNSQPIRLSEAACAFPSEPTPVESEEDVDSCHEMGAIIAYNCRQETENTSCMDEDHQLSVSITAGTCSNTVVSSSNSEAGEFEETISPQLFFGNDEDFIVTSQENMIVSMRVHNPYANVPFSAEQYGEDPNAYHLMTLAKDSYTLHNANNESEMQVISHGMIRGPHYDEILHYNSHHEEVQDFNGLDCEAKSESIVHEENEEQEIEFELHIKQWHERFRMYSDSPKKILQAVVDAVIQEHFGAQHNRNELRVVVKQIFPKHGKSSTPAHNNQFRKLMHTSFNCIMAARGPVACTLFPPSTSKEGWQYYMLDLLNQRVVFDMDHFWIESEFYRGAVAQFWNAHVNPLLDTLKWSMDGFMNKANHPNPEAMTWANVIDWHKCNRVDRRNMHHYCSGLPHRPLTVEVPIPRYYSQNSAAATAVVVQQENLETPRMRDVTPRVFNSNCDTPCSRGSFAAASSTMEVEPSPRPRPTQQPIRTLPGFKMTPPPAPIAEVEDQQSNYYETSLHSEQKRHQWYGNDRRNGFENNKRYTFHSNSDNFNSDYEPHWDW